MNPLIKSRARRSQGARSRRVSFTATAAKNDFGRLLEKVILGDTVVITKHNIPRAVLLSLDEFNALSGSSRKTLDTLTAEFDAMLARMQGPQQRKAVRALFASSPEELGKAAVTVAKRHA
jgi:antitoxin Phd